ncbi:MULTISPECIES: hypothetical protein [unclassified Pseudomonas]|uniref:hypothetical protein n=1 Tax=unclassified Pseudomonas TaxID=196821 RepID=UPI0015A11B90|nr:MULTISPECIES: hypothetical protein [unclassified Pseudomonas]NWC91076.1 hypothetical protein [Pseudomonas sp. IPO3779]NWD16555.1 hypothetical protein [Pseudomonas sp. IPO3778]
MTVQCKTERKYGANPAKKAGLLPEKNQAKNAKSGGTEDFIKTISCLFSNAYIDKKLTTSRLFNAWKKVLHLSSIGLFRELANRSKSTQALFPFAAPRPIRR